MEVGKIWLDALVIGERHRQVDAAKVDALAESMKEIGLQQPISVWFDEDDTMRLIAGLHRVRAAEKLGWEQIDAVTVELNEVDRELWEIDENLMRSSLSPAEEAHHLARRRELWAERQTKESGTTCSTLEAGGRGNRGFAAETAEATGRSKQDINRAISRAVVPPDVMNVVYGTELDKGIYLDELKRLPDPSAMKEKVGADLDRLAHKEQSAALKQDAAERKKEAKEAKKHARIAACDMLLDALSPKQWDQLIELIEQAGGSLRSHDLRNWQSPADAEPEAT